MLSEPLNRAARNKTLDIKKPQYLSSEIKMTNDDLIEFINQNDQKWDEKIIKTRSKNIAKVIISTFDIFIDENQ